MSVPIGPKILLRLKSKEPRLRDWNMTYPRVLKMVWSSWNQKNLDYEIETMTKSISVWHHSYLKSKEPRLRDWNRLQEVLGGGWTGLEIKRTSITRLKQVQIPFRLVSYFASWNQKNLDYEIETSGVKVAFRDRPYPLKSKEPRLRDWNGFWVRTWQNTPFNLKSKEPRLRDWNATDGGCAITTADLKSKEPRLRDWNIAIFDRLAECLLWLEIKRTSITRLKHTLWSILRNLTLTWNQKNLDYEIETICPNDWGIRCFGLEIKRTSITRLKPVNW